MPNPITVLKVKILDNETVFAVIIIPHTIPVIMADVIPGINIPKGPAKNDRPKKIMEKTAMLRIIPKNIPANAGQ